MASARDPPSEAAWKVGTADRPLSTDSRHPTSTHCGHCEFKRTLCHAWPFDQFGMCIRNVSGCRTVSSESLEPESGEIREHSSSVSRNVGC